MTGTISSVDIFENASATIQDVIFNINYFNLFGTASATMDNATLNLSAFDISGDAKLGGSNCHWVVSSTSEITYMQKLEISTILPSNIIF
jgi:hypothetical protein